MNVKDILAAVNAIHRSVAAEVSLLAKLREEAAAQGATSEQLQTIDVRMTDTFARREGELKATASSQASAPTSK